MTDEGADTDAVTILERAGIDPDPWQRALLTSDWERALLNCARQSGKTTVSAALALEAALQGPDCLVLILAPARRQSKEFLRSARTLYRDAGCEVGIDKQSELRLRFENESRIIALPGKEGTVRGYTADLVVADEAARVPDSAYVATRPMLAVSGGRFVGLSTPAGQRGWFYTAWSDPSQDWERVKVTGHDCPRMSESFLETERQEMGDWQFRNEYLCHPGSTEVALTDGSFRRIDELTVGDTVLHSTGDEVRGCVVVAKRQTGVKPLLEVTTETGRTVTATPEHRVKTEGQKVPLAKADTLEYVFTRNYPTDSTSALARLVGFNLGDGHARRGRNTVVHFYGQSRRDMEWIARDLVNAGLCSTEPDVRFKRGAREAFDAHTVGVYGGTARALQDAGCVTGAKVDTCFDVPEWIQNASGAVQVEFLAALWGAEGSTPTQTNRGPKNCNAPILSMYDRADSPFFDTLAEMHRQLGIEVSVYPAKEDGQTLQVIGGKETTEAFFRHVGYRYAEEKERKAWLWSRYLAAQLYRAEDRIRQVRERNEAGESLRSISHDMGHPHGWAWGLLNRNADTPEVGRDFPGFPEWVSARWDGHALRVGVERRRKRSAEPVYNVTVSSPDHSYLLGSGLNNYNCEFQDTENQLFRTADIEAALTDEVGPLFDADTADHLTDTEPLFSDR